MSFLRQKKGGLVESHSVGFRDPLPFEPLDEFSQNLNIMQWDAMQILHF